MGFFIGGLIGITIVYTLFFNFGEKLAWDIAWNMFWTGIQNREFIFSWNDLKTSSIFWKTIAGFIVGGIIGGIVEDAITNKNKD